jgi:mono/diheme cytochrome c family protein
MRAKSLAWALSVPAAMLVAGLAVIQTATAQKGTAPSGDLSVLERGRYLVVIGGCNDCHTPGYPQQDGKVPDSEWLVGSPVGFQGPWGTSYPANLRLLVQGMTEDEWVKRTRAPMRPPMPWFNLRDMQESDVRAMYRYIRAMGPKGVAAPEAVAPGQAVRTPYVVFVPQNLPNAVRTSN